jgi:hypothetical protein
MTASDTGSETASPTPPGPRLTEESNRSRVVALVLLGVLLLVIAAIVLSPIKPDAADQQRVSDWLSHAQQQGFPRWIKFGMIEAGANVVMFTPLGFLGAIALRRHTWLVIVAGTAMATAAELAQWIFLHGRVASPRDVLAGAIGSVLGWLIALPWTRRHRRIRASRARGRVLAA